MAAVVCRDMTAFFFETTYSYSLGMTAYSFEKTDLLLWNDWLYAQNVMPCLQYEHVAGCCVIGGWAKHITVVGRVTACVLPVGSWHSHVEGPFLSTALLWFLELMWEVPLLSGCTRGPLLTTVGSFHSVFHIYFLHLLVTCNLFSYLLVCV